MIQFLIKELLEKNNMSRYRFQFLTGFDIRRVNAFYFNKAKNIKVSELETICDLFNCDTNEVVTYKPNKKK